MATETPDAPAVLPAHETDGLWTSDSESGRSLSDSVVQPEPVEIEAEPETEAEPTSATPAAASAAGDDATDETATRARDAKGQFTKPEAQKKNPRDNPYARVQAATRKEAAAKEAARVAQERADRLEREIAELRKPQQPAPSAPAPSAPAPSVPASTFPTFEAWSAQHPNGSYEDYNRAQAQDVWEQNWAKARAEQAADAQRAKLAADIADARATRYSDWDEVVGKSSAQVSGAMDAAIAQSTQSADLVYWLAEHPDQCAQLARDTQYADPAMAATWVRSVLEREVSASRAAARPESAAVVRPSAASPPVTRVGGTASVTPVDPDDLDFGPDYLRAENDRERKRKEARRW